MDKSKWISGSLLGIVIVFQVWVAVFKSSIDLSLVSLLILLPLSILMLLGPLLWAVSIFIKNENPYLSLTVTIPSALIYLAAYNLEFNQEYQGGGASMVYAVAWVYALIASIVCYFSYKFIESKIRNLTT